MVSVPRGSHGSLCFLDYYYYYYWLLIDKLVTLS